MSGYAPQVDEEKGQIQPNATNDQDDKLVGWTKFRALVVLGSITMFFVGLFLCSFFIAGLTRIYQTGSGADTANATYIDPIILRTYCQGGSWVGYVGVIYDTRNPTFGRLTFYPITICDDSLANLQTRLQQNYPINGTTTVWFYSGGLPTTYVSNPYRPLTSDSIFILLMIFASLTATVFIVVPFNVIMVKCFGWKAIGTKVCCPPCGRWIG